MKTLTSLALISLIGFATACSANTSDKDSETSSSDDVQLVGDTDACKDVPVQQLACANGPTKATCEVTHGKAAWNISCDDTKATASLLGNWGGEHVSLKVDEKGAKLDFDCAVGEFGPVTLNADGTFKVTGTFTSEAGGPSLGWEPNPKSTDYWGTITGDSLVLYVQPVDGPDASKFDLKRNADGIVYKCQ